MVKFTYNRNLIYYNHSPISNSVLNFFKIGSDTTKPSSGSNSTGNYAIGLQGIVGLGPGQNGKEQTVGFFITSNGTFTIYNTDGYVDKRKDDWIDEAAVSFQGVYYHSPNGKIDVSGNGQSYGWGLDPGSISYATDNKKVHDFRAYAAGPSAGFKVAGAVMQTKTTSHSFNLFDWWVNTFARDY